MADKSKYEHAYELTKIYQIKFQAGQGLCRVQRFIYRHRSVTLKMQSVLQKFKVELTFEPANDLASARALELFELKKDELKKQSNSADVHINVESEQQHRPMQKLEFNVRVQREKV